MLRVFVLTAAEPFRTGAGEPIGKAPSKKLTVPPAVYPELLDGEMEVVKRNV